MKQIHIALTFDVEQWDGDSRARALSTLIDALGATPSTWFVTEDRTQSFTGRYPELVERLLAAGHELGAHVHFQRAAFPEMASDVRLATTRLRGAGSSCFSFRGGAHVFNDRLAEEILSLGYRFDSSAVPGLVRRYHTPDGDTFAAWPHILSARPFWWRPGLLELPTASFPATRPLAFVRKRLRVPLLLSAPEVFRTRALELARAYPAPHVPLVVIGHASDVDGAGVAAQLRQAIAEVGADPSIRWCTLAGLGGQVASGAIDAGLRQPPARWVSALATSFTKRATSVAARARRLSSRS
jgi:hypothetical protein